MKRCILNTFLQTQQHSEGKLGIKKRTTALASIFKENMVQHRSNIGSKPVDLFCPSPCPGQVHFKDQTLQILGLSCSDLLGHFHTKNFHIQKRSVNQCFSVFLSGNQTLLLSSYICKAICYISLHASLLHL